MSDKDEVVGLELRKELGSRKVDKYGPVFLHRAWKTTWLSVQLDYLHSLSRDSTANSADNSPSLVQNSTDKVGYRHGSTHLSQNCAALIYFAPTSHLP